jgi:hypothetical protein
MLKSASIICATAVLTISANAASRDQRIDGSSARAFEQSIALLLTELPRRRREDFEIALAVIWIRNFSDGSVDIDRDGDIDVDDVLLLNGATIDMMAAIARGDLVPALQRSEATANGYTAEDYFKQLDGLQYDEVMNLAVSPGSDPSISTLVQEIWCTRPTSQSSTKKRVCDRAGVADCPSGRCISRKTFGVLDTANDALDLQQYAEARFAIESLDFDELTPYERARAEHILARISYEERNYQRSREHLQNAIYAAGMTLREDAQFQHQITLLSAQLSANQSLQ